MKLKLFNNKKALILPAFVAITTIGFSQQLNINPVVGQVVTNYPIAMQLADSGANGQNQVWDFSTFIYDNNSPIMWTYRVLTSDELVDFPSANMVQEDSEEGPVFLNVSADSLAWFGGVASNGNPLTYSNPGVKAEYPFVEGQLYTDTAIYSYLSGMSTVEATQYVQWEVVGTGTLITPERTIDAVFKVKTSALMYFAVNGTVLQTVHVTRFDWLHPDYNMPLLTISYDDYSDSSRARMLAENQVAAIAAEQTATIGIYPNPATDVVTINGEFDRYELLDVTGRILKTGTSSKLEIADLASNQYVLRIYKNDVPVKNLQIVKR